MGTTDEPWLHALTAFTLLYAFVGFFLFIYYRESIVIKNRNFKMILFEQVNIFITLMITVIFNYKFFDEYVSCEVYQIFLSCTSINAFLTLIARMSFTYNYLLKKELFNRFGLSMFCRIFWSANNSLKKKNVFAIVIIANMLNIGNIIGYDIYSNVYYRKTTDCSGHSIYFITYFNYAILFLFLLYSAQFIRYRIKDEIWLSYELVLFTIGLILAIIVPYLVLSYFGNWTVFCEAAVTLFFGLYFPIIVHIRHAHKLRTVSSKATLLSDIRMELCKKFYCEENALFLDSYELYTSGQYDEELLVQNYIVAGAPYELNISFDLRMSVLKSKGDQRKSNLKAVYDDIELLIQLNILPYMDK